MPTWLARRAVDLVGTLTDIYYTRKYGAMARRLGRPDVTPADRRGFIIVQIDGLSHAHLVRAIAAGYMPYLRQLLAERRLMVGRWRCGLPSSTLAVQAGMMFGNRFDIPGYRWYEKDRGMAMRPRHLDRMRIVRDRVGRGRTGILRGGSCYVSMLDGDADLALFTLSTFQRQRFFERAHGLGLFLLFLLSPFRVLRTLSRATASYLTELGRRLIALVRPSVLNPLDVLSPLLHAAGDALFTEVQTLGVMLDIYRCVPAIYANYTSYDEAAHNLGPDHPAAFRVLHGLDKRVHQIDRMRSNYRRREYDLYVISDHGNTPSVPFSRVHGSSLGQYISAEVGEGLSVDERMEAYAHSTEKTRYLLEEMQALEGSLSPHLRPVLAAARRYVDRRVLTDQASDYNLERQRDVVVSVSGPLAHIYFNISSRPLDLFEVILLYPRLLDRLLATSGIGMVIGRAEERTLVLGERGSALVIGDEDEARGPDREGSSPLAAFGDADYVGDQIHRLAHFPHAGDLIVLGAIGADGEVVTFEQQVATHGGLGGPQGRPFITWPPERPLAPGALNDAHDLYPYFMQRYQRQFLSEDPGPGDARAAES